MGIFRRGSSDDKFNQWNGNDNSATAEAERRALPMPHEDRTVDNLGTLMERVSLNSVQEIDRLIEELETLKIGLQDQADRVQRDIIEFASRSQSAMQSTRIIAESLTHWRNVPGRPNSGD